MFNNLPPPPLPGLHNPILSGKYIPTNAPLMAVSPK